MSIISAILELQKINKQMGSRIKKMTGRPVKDLAARGEGSKHVAVGKQM